MHVQLLSISSGTMTLSAPSKWLAEEISLLLSTPHVTMLPHSGGVPVESDSPDLFSTRFNHIFMRHARGLVGGKEVDRVELMQTLLALQKRWSAADCTYHDCELHHRIEGFHVGVEAAQAFVDADGFQQPEMGVKMQFTPSQGSMPHTLVWEAWYVLSHGRRHEKDN